MVQPEFALEGSDEVYCRTTGSNRLLAYDVDG